MKILIAGYRASKIIPHLIEHSSEIDVIELLAAYYRFTALDNNSCLK